MAHRSGCIACALTIAILPGLAAICGPPAVAFAQEASTEPQAAAPTPEPPATPRVVTPHAGTPAAADPLAARIAYLHERLRITPAQETLWAALAQVIRDNARTLAPLLRERYRTAQGSSATDYLSAFEKLGEAQLDGLKKFVAAFQALYDSMSEQQKKIADVILRLSPLAVLGGIFQLPETFTSPPRDTDYPPELAGEPPPVYYPTYPTYPYSEQYPLDGYEAPAFLTPPVGLALPFVFARRHGHYSGAAPLHRGSSPVQPHPMAAPMLRR